MAGLLKDRIIGAESGGNATAKNPRSSATGAGQFIEGTWLDMIGKHRPDLAGLPRDQVLALRNDPALSRQMTQAYADENAAGLRAAGLPVNDGTQYLAHFAGLGGARSALSSDPSTPIANVLPADSIQANPFLQGWTAGQLVDWSARKVGSAAPAMTMPGGCHPLRAVRSISCPGIPGSGPGHDDAGGIGGESRNGKSPARSGSAGRAPAAGATRRRRSGVAAAGRRTAPDDDAATDAAGAVRCGALLCSARSPPSSGRLIGRISTAGCDPGPGAPQV